MKVIHHIFKLIFIKFYYAKYVLNNDIIAKDVLENMCFRSPKNIGLSDAKKFKHLMVYYTDFAYLFFWRINKFSYINRKIFYNDNTSICKIFRNTNLKGGVVSCHPFSTIINAKEIGQNFKFRNNTTIGNKNNDNNLRPVIGNNVELGANVVVIGDITIGDNVLIGAGAVVAKSIPSNSIAYGNPVLIKPKE